MGRIYIESKVNEAPKAIETTQQPAIQFTETVVEVPKEIEVIKEVEVVRTEYVEVPVEVIREVEVIKEIEVVNEVEVERVVKVIEKVEVPVEKIIRIEDMGKLEQLRSEIADYKRKNKILSIGLAALILLTMIMGAINV